MKLKMRSILAIALCAVGFATFAAPQTIDGSGVTWELTDGNTGGWDIYKDFIKSWLPTVEYLDWDDVEKKLTNAVCTAGGAG